MKITHIYHSGFSVEGHHFVCIFDWYKGELPEFSKEKMIYVFVSHKHPDHYGTCIWSLRNKYPNILFILDRAIKIEKKEDIFWVRSNQKYQFENIEITTFLSTDTGVAYLVKVENKLLFHAGDLNIWYWKGEDPKNNKWQIGTYKAEIKKLLSYKIDVAFLPLDPRLEENATLGLSMFLQQLSVDYVFPMHYLEEKKKMLSYLKTNAIKAYRDKIKIEDTFQIDK